MKINELDLAELRLEFRRLYNEIGYAGSIQVLYELLVSVQTLCEVIQDEEGHKKDVES